MRLRVVGRIMPDMHIAKITLRECFKQARANTKLSGALKRDLGVGPIAGFLAWWYLPEKQAVEEITAITLAVAAACLIWPCLEFSWNFVAAPVRILNDNLETINNQIATLNPTPVQEESPPPNYVVWGKRRELRIDEAAKLMAGLHPVGDSHTPESLEHLGLLREATERGKIGRTDKTRHQLESALVGLEAGGKLWNDVFNDTPITMITLLKFLQNEGLALDFVEKVKPYVSR